jgi:hypothetical protein
MSKVNVHTLVCSAQLLASMFLFVSQVHGQQATSPITDTAYTMPTDSVRAVDSAYRARKAQLDKWIQAQRSAAHPQEDFLSVYAGYGGYLEILPRDLNQLFSERTLRPDPASDRDQYETVDRSVMIVGQAQLSRSWGIYFEYDFLAKWFNTQISQVDSKDSALLGAIEELDLTEHSFIVGGMFVIYSGRFYRLRVNGGFGAVIALTSETESPYGYTRSASAVGYQTNFDIMNDFRVMQNMSFTLDIVTRTITTGALKTSGGQTLDASFGVGNPSRIMLKPTASNVVYGLAAGLAYYF